MTPSHSIPYLLLGAALTIAGYFAWQYFTKKPEPEFYQQVLDEIKSTKDSLSAYQTKQLDWRAYMDSIQTIQLGHIKAMDEIKRRQEEHFAKQSQQFEELESAYFEENEEERELLEAAKRLGL